MSNEELEEIKTGSMGSQFASFTLNPEVARAFKNIPAYAKKTGMSVIEMDLTPEHVAMIGHPGELELVVDYGQGYNPDEVKVVEKYSLREAPDTPEFKRWFGNSEVVDENGKPMVVYHSTPKFEGNAFRYDVKKKNRTDNVAGFYFAPSTKDPDDYAVNRETGKYGEGAQVIPVYLSIKNPYIYGKSKVTKAMLDQYREELIADNQHMSDEKVKEWSESKVKYFTNGEVPFYGDGDSKQRILKAGGYDGFLDGRHWVAFESNQVKSAIGNSGQFDVNNPMFGTAYALT